MAETSRPGAAPQVARSRTVRILFGALGWLFLVIAIIGIAVPLIPTTGPTLLSGFFFARSSERFDTWLTNHRVLGAIIRDWRAGAGFSRRLKAVAITAIVITFTLSVGFLIDIRAVQIGLILLAIGIIIYILRLPTKPEVEAEV